MPSNTLFANTGNVYKFGRIIFGTIKIVRASGTFSNYLSYINAIPSMYRPASTIEPICNLYVDSSTTPTSAVVGYSRISPEGGGVELSAGSTSNMTCARIQFAYIIP